jgi:hypothetical protein
VLAAVDLYIAAGNGVLAAGGEGLATAGVGFLALGLVFRFAPAIPWAILFVGAGYILERLHAATADGWSAIVGAGLLLAAELAAWSIGHDRRIVWERSLVLRRALTIAGVVAASAFVCFLLVAAAALSGSAGLAIAVLGVGATVAATGVILRLARG